MNRNKIFGLSLVTAMLLGSSAYAGKIIGVDASTPYTKSVPQTQFGWGGWDLVKSNVVVNITDRGYENPIPDSFDITTGTYDPALLVDRSFESFISTGGEVRARLHGKDWPVGEPSGIKIINNDSGVHGKPDNCIMNTSFLEGHYLDDSIIKPVLCSSDFQTHKRFKVLMLPSTVEGVANGSFGKPIDFFFNLDTSDSSTAQVRYQVLQKIDNYTGKRLDGYSIEVLDAKGEKNPALTLSLGAGEGDGGGDIWEKDELANFSHGLWGPIDDHFSVPGFFDDKRAYYPVTLAADRQSLSYYGDMLGGNYQALFGNWLPSINAPVGIFYDTDNDPSTDADLVAYYGDPLNTGEDGWHRGKSENWAAVSALQVEEWLKDTRYTKEVIEDTLNLGINYIVEIGNNATLGNQFIIRIKPHVAADQTTPPTGVEPTDPTDPGTDLPTDSEGNTASSGGGGCTYNPDSKSFDMMFLLIAALGMFYPFRRKFFA